MTPEPGDPCAVRPALSDSDAETPQPFPSRPKTRDSPYRQAVEAVLTYSHRNASGPGIHTAEAMRTIDVPGAVRTVTSRRAMFFPFTLPSVPKDGFRSLRPKKERALRGCRHLSSSTFPANRACRTHDRSRVTPETSEKDSNRPIPSEEELDLRTILVAKDRGVPPKTFTLRPSEERCRRAHRQPKPSRAKIPVDRGHPKTTQTLEPKSKRLPCIH